MCGAGCAHAFERWQGLLTASQSLLSSHFQLLLFIVTTLMFLRLGVLFNYDVYSKYQLPWLCAQACSMRSALLVTASLVSVHYLLMVLDMTGLF